MHVTSLPNMSLSKQTSVDRIEILEDNQVQVREVTRVMENGAVLATTYHRFVLQPGDDVSTQTARVQAVCAAIWNGAA